MTQLRDDREASAHLAGLALSDIASTVGLGRIHMLAWRDLDDPEAGGSELHAATVARYWADAGIEVTMRTSVATGLPLDTRRDGYRVVRRSGRYMVFPRTIASGLSRRLGEHDGLVEIWNGMPFFSPLWARGPRVVFLHHVHAEMWKMVMGPRLARLGWFLESRLAPPMYRNTRIVTLSESSRDEIVELLGLPDENISVVPPGIDPRFSPGGSLSPTPLVVAVGRLVPVKRFDHLVETLCRIRPRHPGLRAVIVGEGYERARLEELIDARGARDWIALPGRLDDTELIDLYRSAWVVASSSQREGWGMTLTEAAACGTPCVATDIAGHSDAVDAGRGGLLATDAAEFEAHLDAVLGDPDLRAKLAGGALRFAGRFTWEATARGTLEALAVEASGFGA